KRGILLYSQPPLCGRRPSRHRSHPEEHGPRILNGRRDGNSPKVSGQPTKAVVGSGDDEPFTIYRYKTERSPHPDQGQIGGQIAGGVPGQAGYAEEEVYEVIYINGKHLLKIFYLFRNDS